MTATDHHPARFTPSPRSAALAIALVAPAPTIGVWAAMIQWPGGVEGQVIFLLCKLWMFIVPAAWYLLIERRPFSWSPPKHGGLLVGGLLGLAISAIILLGYLAVGRQLIDIAHLREIATRNGIGTLGMFMAGAIYWITLNSLLEEFTYRWFLVEQGERLLGGGGAVLLSALLFTIHHTIALKLQFGWAVTILGSAGVFTGGAIWSWLYLRYRSIWPCYLSHAIVDVAVFGLGWWLIFGA